MRVTEKNRFSEATFARTRAASDMQKKAQVAASGNRVNVPSDDPYAFSVGKQTTDRIGILTARKGAAEKAQSDLELGESSLATATDLLQKAKELAVQGRNGTMDAASRASLGTEIDSIRSSLLAIANTRGASGYLFGGTATQTPPFSATGAFVGNDAAVDVALSDNVAVRGNGSGAQAFTAAGGTEIFADLANLSAALSTNNVAGIDAGMNKLDAAQTQVVGARVSAGLAAERLSTGVEVMDQARESLMSRRAAAVEADPVSAYSDLTEANAAYERALAVTKQILSVNSSGNS
jgi:flagellar hook-associated protein 3 FlgL